MFIGENPPMIKLVMEYFTFNGMLGDINFRIKPTPFRLEIIGFI